MKKLIIALFCLALIATTAEAGPYKAGTKDLNLGIGLGSSLYGDAVIPPISASLDFGYNKDISIGGYLGFATTSYGIGDWEWNYTHIIIGARGAYHFYNEDKIDAYGGLMLGYNIISVSEPDGYSGLGYTAESSHVTWNLFLGARYNFNPKISAFAELGYGISYLTLGVSFKI